MRIQTAALRGDPLPRVCTFGEGLTHWIRLRNNPPQPGVCSAEIGPALNRAASGRFGYRRGSRTTETRHGRKMDPFPWSLGEIEALTSRGNCRRRDPSTRSRPLRLELTGTRPARSWSVCERSAKPARPPSKNCCTHFRLAADPVCAAQARHIPAVLRQPAFNEVLTLFHRSGISPRHQGSVNHLPGSHAARPRTWPSAWCRSHWGLRRRARWCVRHRSAALRSDRLSVCCRR